MAEWHYALVPTTLNVPTVPSSSPYKYIEFDGDSSYIDCGSDASIDNLPTVTFTVDGWIRENDWTGVASVISQHEPNQFCGWDFDVLNGSLYVQIQGATNASSWTVQKLTSGLWYHVVYYFDSATGFVWCAIDGAWCTYSDHTALDTYSGDADNQVWIGRMESGGTPAYFYGDIQWLRISSGDRFGVGVNFAPPAKCAPPAVDGTTIELWAMDEGTGAVTAASVVPANQGAMTDCVWQSCT